MIDVDAVKLVALILFGAFTAIGASLNTNAYVAAALMLGLFIYLCETYDEDVEAETKDFSELSKMIEETRSEVDKLNLMMGLGMKGKK